MGNRQCKFCGLNGISKKARLYEDDDIYIFKDRSPVATLHLQCIPKRHIKNINYLTINELKLLYHMYETAKNFIQENYSDLIKDDNNKPIFGFHKPPFYTVGHLHMHCIVPPYTNSFMRLMNCCTLKDFFDVVKEIEQKY